MRSIHQIDPIASVIDHLTFLFHYGPGERSIIITQIGYMPVVDHDPE